MLRGPRRAVGRGIGRIVRLHGHMRRDKTNHGENPESDLTIRLFGGMAILDAAGADYLPRSRKTRAIVAILTLTAPKSAQRGQLTALLWSQRGAEQGRASLRQSVHELQRTLGSPWNRILLAERHCLSIDLQGVSVDAFQAVGEAAPKTELLRLFEVGFLEDLGGLDPAFDIWLAKERRRMAAIARVGGEAFLEEPHPREATIEATCMLLRLDPANDGAWRTLIEAHIDAGDRAAARFACEQWGDAMGLVADEAPPPEMAGFLSRIRFGSGQRPVPGRRSEAVTAAVMEDSIRPEGAPPDWSRPEGDGPKGDRQAEDESAGLRSDGIMSDEATPGRIMPGGGVPDEVMPFRGRPDEKMPVREMPTAKTRARILEDIIAAEEGMPDRFTRDATNSDEVTPFGSKSRVAMKTWDPALAREADEGRSRSSLRLGIREMRVIGPNVDQALSAGLAEEVTTALSRFRWISCVSGSSLAAIAAENGEASLRWPDLDLLLDGTIQSGGSRVRISVRLLDMRAGEAVIWANRFDHDASDTLTVQDRVAAAIVAQVDPLLLIREGDRAATRNPRGVTPRDLVLQAVPAIYRMDRLSFHAAGELLEAALRIEPGHTDALAWYAYWHLFLVGQGWADDADAATRRAGVLADTAVAMDPNDARSLTLAGHVRGFLLKRPAEAAVLHERAISLNPNLAIAWCFSGFTLSYMGDHATALVRMAKAIELSPSDPHLFFFEAAIIMPHLLLGEYAEAAAAGRKAIELNPWFSSSFKGCLAALGHLGQAKEAAGVMTRLLKLEPNFTVRDAIRRSPMSLTADVERYAEGLRQAGLPE